ncbi:hypothetical protein HKD37_05G012947 [Glycine soja]
MLETITLDNVASFLHLLITSAFHAFDALDVDQVMDLLVELLEVRTQEARDEAFQCRGTYVRLAWLQDIYHGKCDARQWTLAARAYLLHLVGCTLFANKSVTHTSVDYHERKPLDCRWKSRKTLLVSMYHKHLDGLTSDIPYGDHCSFREFKFISLFSGHIKWGSSIVIHRLERVIIPPHPAAPSLSIEEIDDIWLQFFRIPCTDWTYL